MKHNSITLELIGYTVGFIALVTLLLVSFGKFGAEPIDNEKELYSYKAIGTPRFLESDAESESTNSSKDNWTFLPSMLLIMGLLFKSELIKLLKNTSKYIYI